VWKGFKKVKKYQSLKKSNHYYQNKRRHGDNWNGT